MPDLEDRIAAYVEARRGPCSSLHLADRYLKVGAVGEALATKLLAPVLEPRGFRYSPAEGWRRGDDGGGEAAAREPAEPRQVACAAYLEAPAGRRGRSARLTAFSARPPDTGRPLDAGTRSRIGAREWLSLSRLLDGAEAVFIDPRREAAAILAELARRRLPGPASVRSLHGAVRGAVRLPRGCRPSGIASALGVGWSEEDTATAAAANVAACLEAARRLRARSSHAPASGPTPAGLSPSLVADAPGRPGTYEFFDEEGKLLYVGKSSNLKRRLASYAAGAAGGGRPVLRDLGRVARVRWRETGSDLAALLDEAGLIARKRPAANVQRAVRERGRAYAPSRLLAYLLPGADPGAVIVLLARRAALEGVCRVGPRGGGLAAARRMVSASWARRDEAGGGERSADSEIMNSWLAKHGERVSRVELDACRSASHAAGVLERAIREEREGSPEPSYHR